MNLYYRSLRRQAVPAIVTGIIYAVALIANITVCNSDSIVFYQIDPYVYAASTVDFFLGLFVSVPFAASTFFMRKNNFLDYVPQRMPTRKYLQFHISAILTACFAMVFIVNLIGIVYSCSIADIETEISADSSSLSDYLLGNMQMEQPILFAVIWSVYKGFICAGICLFAQIIALYVDNLFLALLAPYAYVTLENFVTGNLGIPQFSLTTTFVLNRLTPEAMTVVNLVIGIGFFLFVIFFTEKKLREKYEEQR